MVLSAHELYAIEKMAAGGMGNKKIATKLVLPQSITKRWLQRLRSEVEMVSHDVGRRRLVCVLFCLCSQSTSLELCVTGAFVQWVR